MSDTQHDVAPSGEEVHLPGPSLIPLIAAVGLTLTVIGTTLGFEISIVGLVILILTVIRWVRDTRRSVAELPEHHR